MSERALEDVESIDPDNYLGAEPEPDQEESSEPEYTALEQEAMKDGWTRRDDWEKAGKDPERHKSAHEFVEYGKLKSAMNETKRSLDETKADFDKRIESLNKLHKADIELKIKSLKAQQRTAISEADTEAYDSAQQQIDEIQAVDAPKKEPVQAGKDPLITEWENKNKWIDDPADPKAQIANGLWNGYAQSNPNATTKQKLDYVDQQLEAMGIIKPPSNPRRDSPNETERGATIAKSGSKISMSTLTAEEKDTWRMHGNDIWGGDEKLFLQSVKDSRR